MGLPCLETAASDRADLDFLFQMRLYYLASPYSHKEESMKDYRFDLAARATRYLLERFPNVNIFSPIVHSHVLHRIGMQGDWNTWKRIDTNYIEKCDGLVVLMIPGWEQSVGVTAEIEVAKQLGKTIFYLSATPPNNVWSLETRRETYLPLPESVQFGGLSFRPDYE